MAAAVKTSELEFKGGISMSGGISTSEPKMPMGSEGGTMGWGGVSEGFSVAIGELPGIVKPVVADLVGKGPGAENGCTGGKGGSGGRTLVSMKGGNLKRLASSVGKGPRPSKVAESEFTGAPARAEEAASVGARVEEADSPISSISLTSPKTQGGMGGGGDKAPAFLGALWATTKDWQGGGRMGET